MTNDVIGLDTIVQQIPGRSAATIDEITAIMDAEEEVYFLIDAIGSVIWARMAQPVRIGDLCQDLIAEYEVEQADCERDVIAFTRSLAARKLAKVSA